MRINRLNINELFLTNNHFHKKTSKEIDYRVKNTITDKIEKKDEFEDILRSAIEKRNDETITRKQM